MKSTVCFGACSCECDMILSNSAIATQSTLLNVETDNSAGNSVLFIQPNPKQLRYFDQVALETVILLKYCQYMRERTANITKYNKEIPPNPEYFFVIFAVFSNIYLRKSLDYTNLVQIYPQIYRFI